MIQLEKETVKVGILVLVLVLKLIMLLFGIVLLNQETSSVFSVAVFLFALILTAINQYFATRRITSFIVGIYFILSCFFPILCPFLPLFAFDIYEVDRRYVIGFAIFPFIVSLNGWQLTETILLALLLVLTVCEAYMCQRIRNLMETNRSIRDSSTELNLMLEEKNRHLMAEQAYEVHLATLRERNRIAREIHDNVGHILSRSILQMGALKVTNKDQGNDVWINQIEETLSLAMDNIRRSVHDLRDDSVDLREAVDNLLKNVNWDIDLNYDVDQEMPGKIKYCFLTVLKEALTNTAKHSDATSIHIAVQEHPAIYQLLIHDNGTKAPSDSPDGMGLSNMEERARSLGGHFSTTWKNGFRIFISIPKTGGLDE